MAHKLLPILCVSTFRSQPLPKCITWSRHDGAGSQGHRHDWESATVVFKEDSPGVNMFHRDVRQDFFTPSLELEPLLILS